MSQSSKRLGAAVTVVVAGLTASTVAQAIEYKISGHVNRMIRYADDDTKSDTQFVDNGANASRLRLTSETRWNGLDVGLTSEARWNSNDSANVGIGNDNSNSDLSVAYLDLSFKGSRGTFSLGRGDGAARFAQRQDLSGTELADNYDNRRISSIQFRDMGSFSGLDGSHAVGWFEGDRTDRIRYDTPTFGGSVLSLSVGEGRSWETGLKFDSAAEAASFSARGGSSSEEEASSFLAGLRFIGAIGYSDYGDSSPFGPDDRLAASASVLADNGYNLTVGYGESSSNDAFAKDVSGFYIKPGFRNGPHAFSLSIGENTDVVNGNYDGSSVGLAYQFTGNEGIDVYAGYNIYSIDGNGGNTDLDDVNVLNAGVRVGF